MGSAVSTVSKSPAHPAQVTIHDVYEITGSARSRLHLPQPKVLGTAMGNLTTVEPITGV